ncbi:MAG: ABC transporter substrate-binding protein [Gammaproteobacteria bacterium]|jgi:putative ABC transport system substrate-binding protein|nr:ABC transporter substrate-binding protein [Gammaproteobacteria bacterium]
MKYLKTHGTVLIMMVALYLPFGNSNAQTGDAFTIYMVLWRGCEEACESFKDYIAKKNINAELIIRDADRDKSKLPGFVEEARARRTDLVVTWGTSVTRGIAGTLADQGKPRFVSDIPLVFMAVADPVGSQIIESYENTGRENVTGTRNRVPEVVNINTIRSYYPAFKRLGLLYNSYENNSVIKAKELKDLSKKMNFELVALELEPGADGKPEPESILPAIEKLKMAAVDFIYLGSSSFLDVHRDLFTKSAVDAGIPVLSPYERLVRNSHALLSVAARYQDVGALAGRQAESILVGKKKPGNLPVLSVDQYAYVVNMTTARKLNMFPSVEILQIAETVE